MNIDINISCGRIRLHHLQNFSNRPTIIFLHDSLGSIELWKEFPQKLGELTNCNILIYDRQGHGKSDAFSSNNRENDYMEKEADVLNEIVNHLKLKKVVLFGHSDGGSIALIFAASFPNKVIGLISESAHIFVEEVTLKGIRNAVKSFHTTDLKTKLEKYHAEKTDSLFWMWAETWLSDSFNSWNIENILPSMTCPVLIIQGEDDEYGTMKQVEGIEKNVSAYSRRLILPNVKHTPHKEAKDQVLKCSTEFINRL